MFLTFSRAFVTVASLFMRHSPLPDVPTYMVPLGASQKSVMYASKGRVLLFSLILMLCMRLLCITLRPVVEPMYRSLFLPWYTVLMLSDESPLVMS